MNYWLFQGNPKYYKVLEAIYDFDRLHWTISAYHKQISIGDKVVIWICGKDAGVYAIAEVIDPPKIMLQIPEENYWIDAKRVSNKYFSRIKFTRKLLDSPLLKTDLLQEQTLERFPVFRYPNGVDYKLTLEEWEKIIQLIEAAAI